MGQKTIAVLLGTTVGNVSKHLNKKFESGELSKQENTMNHELSTISRKLKLNTKTANQPILYNFEAIIAIVFSVNSKRALEVRRWAKRILVNVSVTNIIL